MSAALGESRESIELVIPPQLPPPPPPPPAATLKGGGTKKEGFFTRVRNFHKDDKEEFITRLGCCFCTPFVIGGLIYLEGSLIYLMNAAPSPDNDDAMWAGGE
eukprot:SAG22_NODE_344_length_11914_cov_6.665679_5_plen_103_part_00